jgi:hypothetical protein
MTITDGDGSYVTTAETALGSMAEVGIPGSFLVDSFPIMKSIPAWFPGAGWKKKANFWRKISHIFANSPWDEVKKQMVRDLLSQLHLGRRSVSV